MGRKTIGTGFSLRILLVFSFAVSLSVSPSMLGHVALPRLPTVGGNPAPASNWYPSGPAMDTLTFPVFVNPNAELIALATNPSPIDLTDTPIDPSQYTGTNYLTTPTGVTPGFYEVQFNLAQNFWGCNMSFGNSACGKEIRQGISHLIDKNQFVTTELAGFGGALDDPVPHNSGGLLAANPCGWDSAFPQTGSNCVVDSVGGTAYHLAAAGGVTYTWQPALGSLDFCAAAQHFINAGLASGKDPTTCVLTGISPGVGSHVVDFFIRNDNVPLKAIGDSIQQEICALFTGTFNTGCTEFTGLDEQPLANFPGFITSTTSLNLSWGMYTDGAGVETLPSPIGGEQTGELPTRDPFDTALFFSFNSQFVSGISSIKPPNGQCSSTSVPTSIPGDYVYMCVQGYDTISTQMEYAPCLSASGDPVSGQLSPSFANCPSTSNLTSLSAGYKTEDQFGQGAYALPIYYPVNQYVYLSNWNRVIASFGGTPNYFTYLDAWSPSPHNAGTLRQGVSNLGISLNPYASSTYTDRLVLGQIYDTVHAVNPTSETDDFDWMTIKTPVIPTGSLSYSVPAGTIAAYRFNLRNDVFFQNGAKVTAFDVAFSYLSMMAVGVGGGNNVITAITILSPIQLDIDVSAIGPFTRLYLTGQSILPGSAWSQTRSSGWATDDAACTGGSFAGCMGQYTVSSSTISCTFGCKVTANDMNADSTYTSPGFDPQTSSNSILFGSGPWKCVSSSGMLGQNCTSSGSQSVPNGGSYFLQRFGKGTSPGGSLSGTYFRSSGNMALWAWSQDRGVFSNDFLNFGAVSLCFGKPVGTSGCGVWQHGIGGSAAGTVVGVTQVSIVQRFVGVNWISPYDWVSSPPQNIATFVPVLYEGSLTLNPCSIDTVNGYDC